jgi:asparagine synthase (glutamine-hydrolysing)
MCGIVGYISADPAQMESAITRMTRRLAHRGPDAEGVWWDEASGVALGQRRLAIIDLSESGAQPMASPDGRYIIVFNGEIYNHRRLRAQLEAEGVSADWRGHSDTETLLAALVHWGTVETLTKLNGMFAFGLWDKDRRILTLARDRLGEKPMYYGLQNNSVLFGSELKSLIAFPHWQGEVDRRALALYMRFGYVPEPWSIYRNVFKLPPASFVEVTLGQELPEPIPYWDLKEVVRQPKQKFDDWALIEKTEAALMQSVGSRMESDVSLGAFLSGGIDSSVVVAMMQAQSDQPVQTFTIGFDVPGFNEAEAAKAISKHLGTYHTELYVRPESVLDLVPQLPEIWDEPFADSSQLPTLILSQLTRKSVKVALSGDGGDEVFCGYNRYAGGFSAFQRLNTMPKPLRKLVAATLRKMPAHLIDRLIRRMPQRFRHAAIGDKLTKLAGVLMLPNDAEYYRRLVSIHGDPTTLVVNGAEPAGLVLDDGHWPELSDFRECMMYLDAMSYLPGDIMTKVDRATMSVGLEGRAPFLDHDLISFAWSLPIDAKLRDRQTKWVLRRVLERHVPNDLFERPKMGFGVPIEHWLAGPLRDWVETMLDPARLAAEGYFVVEEVHKLWDDHKQGLKRNHHQLWTILMFQAWLDHQNLDSNDKMGERLVPCAA